MEMLADRLERVPPDLFNMNSWYSNSLEDIGECGTTACVAGWALLLAHPDVERRYEVVEAVANVGGNVGAVIEAWLDLEHEQAVHLFMGHWADERDINSGLGKGTPREAAWAIRKMILDEKKTRRLSVAREEYLVRIQTVPDALLEKETTLQERAVRDEETIAAKRELEPA